MSTRKQTTDIPTAERSCEFLRARLDAQVAENNALTARFCRIETYLRALNGEELEDFPGYAITAVGLIEDEVSAALGGKSA